jgi:hypothetical protein
MIAHKKEENTMKTLEQIKKLENELISLEEKYNKKRG